jgi:hypothetical protein
MQDIRAEHTGVPINSRHLDQGGRLRTPGRAGEPSRLVQRAGSVDPSSQRSDHQKATALARTTRQRRRPRSANGVPPRVREPTDEP